MTRSKTPTLIDTITAVQPIGSAFGADELCIIARRASAALEAAPGRSDVDRVAALSAAASSSASPSSVDAFDHMLTALEKIIYICDPKSAGVARWKLAREAMAAAARNTRLVEDVAKVQDPAKALMQAYVDRLTDSDLSLEDYPLVVEELLADKRLKANEQRDVIMRVTGYAKGLLGNNDNRRIALISWRRNKASDKYLFEARANEKRRF